MDRGFAEAVRHNAGDEASTATLLHAEADRLDKAGNHKRASAYRKAAMKAEGRAQVWRNVLK